MEEGREINPSGSQPSKCFFGLVGTDSLPKDPFSYRLTVNQSVDEDSTLMVKSPSQNSISEHIMLLGGF